MYSRRVVIFFGVIFLGLCAIAGGLKDWQNRQFRAAQSERHATIQRLQKQYRRESLAASDEMMQLLKEAYSGSPQQTWTRAELAARLPGAQSLETTENDTDRGLTKAEWKHPVSRQSWTFYFNDQDRLSGYSGYGRFSDVPMPADVPRTTFEDAGEQFRHAIASDGKWLWLILAAAWAIASRWRHKLIHALLAMAIGCTVADAVSPPYTLSDIFSNDAVFIDAAMIAISCAALAATSAPLRSLVNTNVLPRQFGIRWLMAITALIAALVTMRWYGYVIGSVLLIAAISYAFLNSLYRPPSPPLDTRPPLGS
jgi:hypothetical protein